MEPQEYERVDRCCFKNKCMEILAIIIGVAFSAVIGIIIGAAISEAILGALAAIIVLAVILGLLVILSIVLIFCNKKKKDKRCKCICC